MDAWNKLSNLEKLTMVNYSKSPSWWNRLFNNRPKKRNDKFLCVLIRKLYNSEYGKFYVEDTYFDFSHPTKPNNYYW
jgi:hypothetical protein